MMCWHDPAISMAFWHALAPHAIVDMHLIKLHYLEVTMTKTEGLIVWLKWPLLVMEACGSKPYSARYENLPHGSADAGGHEGKSDDYLAA